MAQVPVLTLNDGQKMPMLGLGTWKSKPDEVYHAVKYAIKDAGYRHVDCALVYGNENEVGKALKELFNEGVVKREELFITSKLWCTHHTTAMQKHALETTLKNLQVDYLDLYLIHWPQAYKEGDDLFPKDSNGKMIYSNVDIVDCWRGMIELQKTGKVKSIGVSNFNVKQLERLVSETKVVPAINQVECHPYLTQKELMEYGKKVGMHLTAYSPLGTPDRPWASDSEPILMKEPVLHEISKKYNKTAAQVLIRFHLDRNTVVIPKSVTPARIKQNLDVLDFKLSPEDLHTLENLKTTFRYCHLKDVADHPDYPF